MKKKLLVIINPRAGLMQGKRNLGEIISVFCDAGYLPTVAMTGKSGDGERFVAEYGSDYDRIVCIGGDGTFNEVVSGTVKAGLDVAIGYVPAGSTNDFANSIGLSSNLLTAAKDAVGENVRKYDVGSFNGRIFVYVASFGAFTRASYSAPQDIKNAIGHLAYLLEGMKELSNIHGEHIKVEVDGEIYEDDFIFGGVSNSTSLGGVLKLGSDYVDMNDGLLELILIKLPKNLTELMQIIDSLRTKKYDSEMIKFISTNKVRIKAGQNMPWTIDGEQQDGCDDIYIENLHDAIRLSVPENDK